MKVYHAITYFEGFVQNQEHLNAEEGQQQNRKWHVFGFLCILCLPELF